MRMDTRIPLFGVSPQPINALAAGQEAGAQAQEYQNVNALRQVMQQQGAAAMRGDMNALGAIARFDPAAAQKLQAGKMDMDFAQAGERRAGEAHGLGMRVDSARLRQIEQASAIEAANFAETADAAQVEAERQALIGAFSAAEAAAAQGPEAWDRFNDGLGPEYANAAFEDAPIILAKFRGTLGGLQAQSSNNRASLNPIWGTDANGDPAIMQLSDDGRAIPTQFPEGFTPNKATDRVDAGTEWILLDPVTRQPVGRVPKNNFEAAAETAEGRIAGETRGAAVAGLGGVEEKASQAIDLIDSIVNDPALPGVTGMIQGRIPPLTQGGTDLNVKIEQLRGKAFLEAFESLKGGGAITEIEGQAATRAMARLDRAQSTEEFMSALLELQGIVARGVQRARRKAGAQQPQDGPAASPGRASGPVVIDGVTIEQID
jgi:hypothetical protein